MNAIGGPLVYAITSYGPDRTTPLPFAAVCEFSIETSKL